jgi:hypothetical protein
MAGRPFSRRTFLTGTAAAAAVVASPGRANRAEAATVRVFHVAPDGDDSGPGTAFRPFRTPQKARDAVRAFKRRIPVGDITVYFRQGTYHLTETLELGVADSGGPWQTITYAAYPGETPVFSSGAAITGWSPVSDPPLGLPAAAVGNVWAADVPAGSRFKSLYDDGRMLPVARSAGFSPGAPPDLAPLTQLSYPAHVSPGLAAGWGEATDIELQLMPSAKWMVNILPLASIDLENRITTTQVPGRYALGPTTPAQASAWFQNAIGLLDTPGEWVVSAREGKVLYWPESGRPGDVRAPLLKQLIRVQGEIDVNGPADKPVRHLVFRGLSFTGGERDTWPADYRGREMQHAWDLHDRDNALVQFRGVEDSAIVDCVFADSGHNAIRCDLHCQGVEVSGNLIHDVGASGIILAGYGPGTKHVNKGNLVKNNEVYNTGRMYWHGLGIWVWQSGANRVENNLVHSTPYTGIAASGRIAFHRTELERECAATVRWPEIDAVTSRPLNTYDDIEPFLHTRDNVVERNDVSNVMTSRLSDGNGIYISGAARGNLIRRNYIHDVESPRLASAYRTDDVQYGTVFAENVICRTKGPFGLIHKQRNDVVNTILADLDLDPEEPQSAYLLLRIGPVDGSRLQRNIYYSTRPGQRVVQEGPPYAPHPWPRLHQTDSDYNDYHCTADPQWGAEHLQTYQPQGVEEHSMAVDPLFYNAAESDFRLRPGSLPLAAGFTQIDLLPIGLTADFRYAIPEDPLDRLFVRSGDQFASIHLGRGHWAVLRVDGRTERGYLADLRDAHIAYSSDNSAVATVNRFGIVHAARRGVAEIEVTAIKAGVTKTTSIAVIVR